MVVVAHATRSVRVGPLDMPRTMALQQLGRHDPTASLEGQVFGKAFATDAGIARVRLTMHDDVLHAEAWGPDAVGLLDGWMTVLPPDDGYEIFDPAHPRIAECHAELPGLRILPVPWLFDIACSCVLQQRVTFAEATSSWRRIVEAHGAREGDTLAFPSAKQLARFSDAQLQRLGIDGQRSRTLIALAREESFARFLRPGTPRDALRKRLRSIRGIGAWTTEMILGFGAGDPDALIVGDVHLPAIVGDALGDGTFTDDAKMLQLLELSRGQRFRVSRLLIAAKIAARR